MLSHEAKVMLAEQAEILLLRRGRVKAVASDSHLQRTGQETSCGGLERDPES